MNFNYNVQYVFEDEMKMVYRRIVGICLYNMNDYEILRIVDHNYSVFETLTR